MSKDTRVYADLHIHSKYSRATSMKMDLNYIAHFAELKGLNLVGTGDFSHPLWIKEAEELLYEVSNSRLYKLRENPQSSVYFMLTNEVNTIFEFEGKTKRIHHVLLTPSFETAEQINDRLRRFGDLAIDGRPTLSMSPSELVEEVISVSRDNAIVPAHVWTPWFSLFGSRSGFDRIEDCYEDMTRHIFALETGLSSDPPMNWRLSSLDDYTLVSNSDSHSPYPYRLGREANVFEVMELSYNQIIKAIREKDRRFFRFTIETNPAYGKYHWTGHRSCNVSASPIESRRLRGICPICRKPLTKGVEERIEDLADRCPGFRPADAIGYVHLLPLQEVISTAIGAGNPSLSRVWQIFNLLVEAFGSEYAVLLDAPLESLMKVVEPNIAEAILKVRNDQVEVIPGYDGVYGKVKLRSNSDSMKKPRYIRQSNLERFI